MILYILSCTSWWRAHGSVCLCVSALVKLTQFSWVRAELFLTFPWFFSLYWLLFAQFTYVSIFTLFSTQLHCMPKHTTTTEINAWSFQGRRFLKKGFPATNVNAWRLPSLRVSLHKIYFRERSSSREFILWKTHLEESGFSLTKKRTFGFLSSSSCRWKAKSAHMHMVL